MIGKGLVFFDDVIVLSMSQFCWKLGCNTSL